MARALYKKTETIFGKDLDPTLVTFILEEVWTKGSAEQKEEWRQQVATFSTAKRAKSTQPNSATIDAVA